MRSDLVIVASAHRSPRIECAGGLAARRTGADTVHLVSAAATPLGGDTIAVRVVVEAGARLRLRSVAATVSLPGPLTAESQATWQLEVAGELDIDPQPTVVAAEARHRTETRVQLDESATLRLRERVQIGRSGEQQGFWSGRLCADIGVRPLLRHTIELGAGSLSDDVLDSPRACISELRYPQTAFDTPGTLLPLAAAGCLATWQGPALSC